MAWAANNTPVQTYGEHCITLGLGFGKTFSWVFLIADARQRIIGADFLQHSDLIADVKRQRVKGHVTQSYVSLICNLIEVEQKTAQQKTEQA